VMPRFGEVFDGEKTPSSLFWKKERKKAEAELSL